MDFLRHYLLSFVIFLPAVGAIAVLIVRRGPAVRWTALGIAASTFALSLLLLITFDWHAGIRYAYAQDGGVVQMVQRLEWIRSLHIQYLVGIDGLNFPMVLLTTFVFLLAVISSWNNDPITGGYFALLLILETAILGAFLSLDFFLFYGFVELSLMPMYFLISMWGGPRAHYAAIKFFLFALLGSIVLLLGLIGIYLYTRQLEAGPVFDLVRLAGPELQQKLAGAMGGAGGHTAMLLFALILFGFLMKLPCVSLHGWFADVNDQAGAPVSMILSALMLNIGGYGILRVALPLFPAVARSLWLVLAILGVLNILYGALCAMAQSDFKRLVSYSVISQVGFVLLGAAMMTPASVHGAMFAMLASGIASAALFFIVGVISDRAGHRDIARLGGLVETMPIYTAFASVAIFAAMGLPALCGFIGQVMVLLGCFSAAAPGSALRGFAEQHGQVVLLLHATRWLAAIACTGIMLTAGYMLWTLQRIFLGPPKPQYHDLRDLTHREIAILSALTICMVLLGILPWSFFFGFTNQTVEAWVKLFM